jgi:hypothetical protein
VEHWLFGRQPSIQNIAGLMNELIRRRTQYEMACFTFRNCCARRFRVSRYFHCATIACTSYMAAAICSVGRKGRDL